MVPRILKLWFDVFAGFGLLEGRLNAALGWQRPEIDPVNLIVSFLFMPRIYALVFLQNFALDLLEYATIVFFV